MSEGMRLESNSAESLAIANRAGFVARLFREDISLPITYWVFGVLIGKFAFKIFQALIDFKYFEIVSITAGKWYLLWFYLLEIGYSIFILIAIMRSAAKYQGRAIWANLARIAVILGTLTLIYGFARGLQQFGNTDLALSEEIKAMNKSLPRMIDNNTSLDHVSIQDNDVYYNYALINSLSADLDISRFISVMTPGLKTTQCTNEASRSLLNEGRKLVFIYRDKASKLVTKIVIQKLDCM
jgi:hypothetical protein